MGNFNLAGIALVSSKLIFYLSLIKCKILLISGLASIDNAESFFVFNSTLLIASKSDTYR